ncbi:hypothetical protein SANTM175S_04370 [Streptomyces antimycoticus]
MAVAGALHVGQNRKSIGSGEDLALFIMLGHFMYAYR